MAPLLRRNLSRKAEWDDDDATVPKGWKTD